MNSNTVLSLGLLSAPLLMAPALASAHPIEDDAPISVYIPTADGDREWVDAQAIEGQHHTYWLDLESVDFGPNRARAISAQPRSTNMMLEADFQGHGDQFVILRTGDEANLSMEWTPLYGPRIPLVGLQYGIGRFTFKVEGAWEDEWHFLFPMVFLQQWNPPGLCIGDKIVEGEAGKGTYTGTLDITTHLIHNNSDTVEFTVIE